MHGNITPVPASQSLEHLGAEIMARIAAGDHAKAKAHDHYLAAGLRLLEARGRVTDFNAFLKQHCPNLKRTRAYQLMSIAGGKTTVETERAKTAERMRKHRAAKCPSRDGHGSKRRTAFDVIKLWMQMPATEDRQVFEAIGLRRILAGLPEAWTVKLEEWVDSRRSLAPPAKIEVGPEHEIPADLSIPEFLRQAA
jgi:hypothetical protein